MSKKKPIKAAVIDVDGGHLIRSVTFEAMQDLVRGTRQSQGWLECLRVRKDASGWVNEDGIAEDLPANKRATEICAKLNVGLQLLDHVKGTFIITGAPDEDGEMTDAPADLETMLDDGEL